ncbi:MAG: hypothetical protein U9P42_03830, partial [Candidatus Fermentibacteria bacterium]|nr:hypothetical protein [Candidatus Fermentibacteria bacterium]
AACSTVTTSNIDDIQDRLIKNKCRITRQNLIFRINDLEYDMDTTFVEIPQSLIPDSLLVCPGTDSVYILETDGNDRTIICPAGHGATSF